MDVAAHQFGGGSIDHPVAFHRASPGEGRGGDRDVEVAALTRAGVPRVLGAVIADVEARRPESRFERRAQSVGTLAHRGASGTSRRIQKITPSVNTNASGSTTQALKVTQVDSLK